MIFNVSSVVEFLCCWVLKNNIFGQKATYSKGTSMYFVNRINEKKLSTLLITKVFQNTIIIRLVLITKNVLLNFVIEKKKIRMIFGVLNSL